MKADEKRRSDNAKAGNQLVLFTLLNHRQVLSGARVDARSRRQ